MEELNRFLELVQTLSGYIEKYGLRRVLSFVFIIASAVFLLLQIPSISIILDPITYGRIRLMTIFVMLVSGISLATIYIVNVVDRKIQAAAALRAAAIAQAEKQKREQTIINNMLAELHSLTPDELSLLKYIYHYSCNAVYVPTNNAAGLSLWNRGYLRQTVNRYFPRVHGKAASITTSCYLYEIQPEIKKFLRQFYNSIQWGNSNMEELNKYQ